jgi:hypothetical protein
MVILSESLPFRAMKEQEDSGMTKMQRKAVTALFYVYGNGGPNHTHGDHEFLRRILVGEENPEHFQPTGRCKDAFEKVMEGDYSPLSERIRSILADEE